VAAVEELDQIVAWVRARGPVALPLDGWDRVSIWGWDESAGSLYAHLWHNTDDPAESPAIRIGPDDLTAAITFPETLAQHIAMAVDRSPWDVITALDGVVDQGKGGEDYTGTKVTITEGYSLPEWPWRVP